jgi:hypothetical protein
MRTSERSAIGGYHPSPTINKSMRPTTEEVARRGQELYGRNIRQKVEPEQIGRFLVVDIESGDYEVADDDLSASDRMLARRPEAKLYGLRVGRDYAYRLGGRVLDSPGGSGGTS